MYLWEFVPDGGGDAGGYAGVVLGTGGVVGLGDEAVGGGVVGLVGIEAVFEAEDHKYDQGGGDADGEAGDVQDGGLFEAQEVAEGDLEHEEWAARMVPWRW